MSRYHTIRAASFMGICLVLFSCGCARYSTRPLVEPEPIPVESQSHEEPAVVEIDPSTLALLPEPAQYSWVLAPPPRSMEITGDWRGLTGLDMVLADSLFPILAQIDEESLCPALPSLVELRITPDALPHPEGYILEITSEGIHIQAHDRNGMLYAFMTLRQLARQAPVSQVLPEMRITDWPDFPNRGVMLDISRDKVPQMGTLLRFIDHMTEWKFNQLQLYTEHTFAYAGHEIVWQNASPMTPENIRTLDAYCLSRGIELVPNQNSFGHMHRWLKHEPYAALAERPGSPDLCPIDPGSLALLSDMYAQLLPNFSSSQFNVGCDETFSIGRGHSADAVKQKGQGRVYLDFLLGIHQLVTAHGKRMQFWGDIIMRYPDLIAELPQDVIALEWGYEADHPFASNGRKFAASGIPYYVAPGTSSWHSLAGRTHNALENLRNAARNGRENGAVGYLITDWGDNGHWQFPAVSWGPFLYGASLAWHQDTAVDLDLARALDVHVFQDQNGIMGRLALDLGNAYLQTGATYGNNTVFYGLLIYYVSRSVSDTPMKGITVESLSRTIDYIDWVMAPLDTANMVRADAELILDEYRFTADLMRFACRLGIARMQHQGIPTEQIPFERRTVLAEELRNLVPRYRSLWLERNRPGGLEDSAGRFENLIRILESEKK